MNASKQQILDFAKSNRTVSASILVQMCGMNPVTARQYLCSLAKDKELVRVGQGEYALPEKQEFSYNPPQKVVNLYNRLKAELPFTDFCIYDGSILNSIQHHLSINHAIYVETNRDAIETVFARLKDQHKNVYRQPNTAFMYDYVDLRSDCIIVKALVTESPLMRVEKICVPTLEKMLVDTQKDADFDYLRGAESQHMFQLAFDLYTINAQRLLRYARRRNIEHEIHEIINHIENDQ